MLLLWGHCVTLRCFNQELPKCKMSMQAKHCHDTCVGLLVTYHYRLARFINFFQFSMTVIPYFWTLIFFCRFRYLLRNYGWKEWWLWFYMVLIVLIVEFGQFIHHLTALSMLILIISVLDQFHDIRHVIRHGVKKAVEIGAVALCWQYFHSV